MHKSRQINFALVLYLPCTSIILDKEWEGGLEELGATDPGISQAPR